MEITPRQLELIEAASRLLTTSGVNGLTIKNLAKEMKFSESAIYRHFSSKEDIILAMLHYLAENIDERLSNIPKTENPEENFRAMFQEQFKFFNRNSHFVVAVFSDGLMEESQRINESILKLLGVMMKHLMPLLTDGQQKNIFTNAIANEDLVHIVMGTFKLQMFKWRLFGFEFDLNESGNKMIDSILTLIKTK
ncbi:MAG TPA: TetR/AcrR family transcriptional regulator [Paludibacter sp.]|nr:TetR/AcrR family transcriptional regulator [Paludibacter sp.]